MQEVYGEGEVKHKLGEMTYKLFADVFTSCELHFTVLTLVLVIRCEEADRVVPLMTLLSAGLPPSSLKSEGSRPAILSPEGRKRYAICHGGPPVSKDGVTLDEVAKIDR